MITKFAMIILLLSFIFQAKANLTEKINEKWRWSQFSLQSGLPTDRNIRIVEDAHGVIWACTPEGYAWYDNYIWHKVALPDSNYEKINIFITEPDLDGGVVTTSEGRILHIRKDTSFFDLIKHKGKKAYVSEILRLTKDSYIVSILSAERTEVSLFEYKTGNLLRLYNSEKFKNYPNIQKYLFSDRSGNIWHNRDDGFYRIKNKNFILVKRNYIEGPYDISEPITKINGTGTSFIIMGFPMKYKGIWQLDVQNNSMNFLHAYRSVYLSGDVNPKGEFVAIYQGGMIEIFSNGKWYEFDNFPVLLDEAKRVTFTTSGDLWVSCDRGLYRCNLSTNRFRYIYHNEEIQNNFINEFVMYNDSTLLAATGQGVLTLNTINLSVLENSSLTKSIPSITGLNKDNRGRIWASSGGGFSGLYVYEEDKWKKSNISGEEDSIFIHKIRKDKKGDLWFLSISGTSQISGFGAFHFKDGQFIQWDKKRGLKSNRIYDFLEDRSGSYWFATFSCLSRYKKGKWKHWDESSGLISNRIYTLAEDNNNRIWFSDYAHGVGYIEDDSIIFQPELEKAHVPEAKYIIFDSENNPWISTNSGLFHLTDKFITYFLRSNGLRNSSSWPLLLDNNNLYIGTAGGGINILNLEEKYEPLPKIYINNLYEENENLFISWDVFSYKGKIPSDEIEVRYKIDNEDWSEWSLKRELVLTNLTYGKHKFQIQAKGYFGDYKESSIEREFEIPYPYYYSPFFIGLFLLLILIIIKLIMILMKKKKQEAEKLITDKEKLKSEVETKTKQLTQALKDFKAENNIRQKAQEDLVHAKNNITKAYYKEKELGILKSNTFASITKTFSEPIKIIETASELINYYTAENNSENIIKKIDEIKESTSKLQKIVDEIIGIGEFESNRIEINYEIFDIIDLVKNVINNHEILNSENHKILLTSHFKEYSFENDPTIIKNILNQLISNAIKFTKKSSDINIEIIEITNYIVIKVKDEGIGIPAEFIDTIYEPFIRADNAQDLEGNGFGLTIVKRSVDLLGGKIICSTALNEGTVMSIYLPLDEKQI